MSARVVDSQAVRWYHFLPPLLVVAAIGWLAWSALAAVVSVTYGWHLVTAVLGGIAAILGFMLGFATRRRAGLFGPVVGWLCLVWAKDPAARESKGRDKGDAPGITGLHAADALLLVAGLAFIAWCVWTQRGMPDARFLPSAALIAAAFFLLAAFPGIPSAPLERWDQFRFTGPATEEAAGLISVLKQKARAPSEILGALRKNGVVQTFSRNDPAPPRDEGRLIVEHQLSLVRTPLALRSETLSVEPEVIAIERIRLSVDKETLETLRDTNRSQPLAFHQSLEDHIVASRSREIFELCVTLEALFRKHRLSPWDRLQTVLRFCQAPNIRYVLDDSPESKRDLAGSLIGDYCRYPLETLVDRQGDCDCHSILAACLFYTLGYECCVFALKTRRDRSGHLAVGVIPPGNDVLASDLRSPKIGNRRYCYCETTGAWQVGRIPDDMDPDTIDVWWPRKRATPGV